MKTKRNFLRNTVAMGLICFGLSGCFAAKQPLGRTGQGAMSVQEIHELFGSNSPVQFSDIAGGMDNQTYGFVSATADGKDYIVRLFPFENGIAIELAPIEGVSPLWIYGAVIPHKDGGAVYFDEFQSVRAQNGERDPQLAPMVRALPGIRKAAKYYPVNEKTGVWGPNSLQGVVNAYEAMAAAGVKPMSVIPFSKGSH